MDRGVLAEKEEQIISHFWDKIRSRRMQESFYYAIRTRTWRSTCSNGLQTSRFVTQVFLEEDLSGITYGLVLWRRVRGAGWVSNKVRYGKVHSKDYSLQTRFDLQVHFTRRHKEGVWQLSEAFDVEMYLTSSIELRICIDSDNRHGRVSIGRLESHRYKHLGTISKQIGKSH